MKLRAMVHAKRAEARDVVSLDLRADTTAALPSFSAGAHIDIDIPTIGTSRSYSLCNDPAESHRYVVAVGRDPDSRGGSTYLHDRVAPGDWLTISVPRNHFPLDDGDHPTVLIAGGIGITPIVAMARRLAHLGRSWQLFYCARSPERAAFLTELWAIGGGERVIPIFDGAPNGRPLDIGQVVATATPNTHFYCCGPASLLSAFEQATNLLPGDQVHLERFTPKQPVAGAMIDGDKAFTVKLSKSARTLAVPPGETLLDALIAAGIDVPHSCQDGVCGSCLTQVSDGVPDHRDSVLTPAEAERNDCMLVCVSRSRTPTLTLEL